MGEITKEQIIEKIKEIGVPVNDLYHAKYGNFDYNGGPQLANKKLSVIMDAYHSMIVYTDEEGITRVIPQSLLMLVLFQRVGIEEIHPSTYDHDICIYLDRIREVINQVKSGSRISYHFYAITLEQAADQSKYLRATDQEVFEDFLTLCEKAKKHEEEAIEHDKQFYGEDRTPKVGI